MPEDLFTTRKMKDIRKNDLLVISTDRKLTKNEKINILRPEIVLAFVVKQATGPKFNSIEILVDEKKA